MKFRRAGETDCTEYFKLRLTATGLEATGLTITDLDLSYTRSREVPAAKVDATALAATNSAHADNKAIEIDAVSRPGLYRVDWPDAAFAAGVGEVILTVKHASCFTEDLRVQLDAPVDTVAISGDQGAADNLETMLDGTGGQTFKLGKLEITSTAPDSSAVEIINQAGGNALSLYTNSSTGHAILAYGGGRGIIIISANGDAVSVVSEAGNGDAIQLTKHGTGKAVNANGQSIDGNFIGNITGNLSGSVGSLAAGAITEAAFHADTAKYQAKVGLIDDDTNTTDRYVVSFFKNGQPITSGISGAPTIQVIKVADGTDLVATANMTQIGATTRWRYTETSNRIVDGSLYLAVVTATIDGSSRTWEQWLGRDGI